MRSLSRVLRILGVDVDPSSPTYFIPVCDLGPESILFITAEDSPSGKPLLVVGNEITGTTTIYRVREKNN